MSIPMDSRTENDVFQAWKRTNPTTNWRTCWNEQLRDCIELYEKMNWQLICIAKNEKRPVKGVKWSERDLSYENALILFQEHMNLAVNLRKSQLIIAEHDGRNVSDKLKPYFCKTISVISPHGYHLYFNYDVEVDDKARKKLCRLFKKDNLFRGGKSIQYVLVPLSKVDRKYYEFINTSNLMNISQLIEEVF